MANLISETPIVVGTTTKSVGVLAGFDMSDCLLRDFFSIDTV